MKSIRRSRKGKQVQLLNRVNIFSITALCAAAEHTIVIQSTQPNYSKSSDTNMRAREDSWAL